PVSRGLTVPAQHSRDSRAWVARTPRGYSRARGTLPLALRFALPASDKGFRGFRPATASAIRLARQRARARTHARARSPDVPWQRDSARRPRPRHAAPAKPESRSTQPRIRGSDSHPQGIAAFPGKREPGRRNPRSEPRRTLPADGEIWPLARKGASIPAGASLHQNAF